MKLAITKTDENNQAILPAMKVIRERAILNDAKMQDEHKLITMTKMPLMPPQPKGYIKCKKYDFF